MKTMGPTMNNSGRAKGVEVDPKTGTVNIPVEKETLIERIKNGTKTIIRSLFWSAIILSLESFVIWKIWDYVFDGYALTYTKTFLLILMIRLMFRTTTLDKKV
jgi:hypothetical protein